MAQIFDSETFTEKVYKDANSALSHKQGAREALAADFQNVSPTEAFALEHAFARNDQTSGDNPYARTVKDNCNNIVAFQFYKNIGTAGVTVDLTKTNGEYKAPECTLAQAIHGLEKR